MCQSPLSGINNSRTLKSMWCMSDMERACGRRVCFNGGGEVCLRWLWWAAAEGGRRRRQRKDLVIEMGFKAKKV